MQRETEIDILKTLAITGVVLIHLTSNSFAIYHIKSAAWYAFVTADQAMRFSVPLFVALSGYTLALRHPYINIKIKDFYIRRATRILPYYLLATAIIYSYLHLVKPWSQTQNPYPLWQIILMGKADYHLYFIPMILQLYLVFPFIIIAFKKWPQATIGTAFVSQALIFVMTDLSVKKLITLPFTWGDQQQYLIALTWIFYFVLGISLASISKFSKKNLHLTKILGVTLAVGGLTLTLSESFRLLTTSQDLIEATRFTRFSVMVFATGVILSSVLFAKYLLRIPKLAVRFLAKVGLISFSIYLLHTIAIRMVILNVDLYPVSSFLIFAVASLIASFILAWIFEEILKVTKKSAQALLSDKDL